MRHKALGVLSLVVVQAEISEIDCSLFSDRTTNQLNSENKGDNKTLNCCQNNAFFESYFESEYAF